ncbi:50S ribosomal protein L31 [bacterium]|nr:MAG: 50S ribosomal protein L31 [bacterium]
MKKGIHPQYFKQAKVFVGGQLVGTVGSTKEELHLDIHSSNHPFWTGAQKIIDTEGLADKYTRRKEGAKNADELKAKKEKLKARIERSKAKSVDTDTKKITLKDMLKAK